MVKLEKKRISSYGLIETTAYVCCPENYDEVYECLQHARKNDLKICPAGSKLSFSNVCLITDYILLDTNKLNRIIDFNPQSATITIEAGVKMPRILEKILPYNFSLIGLTGSPGNTVGGNISSDVNGKDSWKSGHFGENILTMKVMKSDGEIVVVDKVNTPELFNAIVGGLGLIAIILEVTLKLQPITNSNLHTESVKLKNIESLLLEMNSLNSDEYDFAYCWTNPFAKGINLGEGICEKAYFDKNAISSLKENTCKFPEKNSIFGLKPSLFWSIAQKFAMPAFFEMSSHLKYVASPNLKKGYSDFYNYQYPMVKYFPDWNLKFAPHGFREWQILFPSEHFAQAYITLLELSRQMKIIPNICAVRKHVNQTPYLSFSGNGFSLTLNYGLGEHPRKLVEQYESKVKEVVFKYNGKVYLSKYPYFSEREIQEMYPDFVKFKSIKQSFDYRDIISTDALKLNRINI